MFKFIQNEQFSTLPKTLLLDVVLCAVLVSALLNRVLWAEVLDAVLASALLNTVLWAEVLVAVLAVVLDSVCSLGEHK